MVGAFKIVFAEHLNRMRGRSVEKVIVSPPTTVTPRYLYSFTTSKSLEYIFSGTQDADAILPKSITLDYVCLDLCWPVQAYLLLITL